MSRLVAALIAFLVSPPAVGADCLSPGADDATVLRCLIDRMGEARAAVGPRDRADHVFFLGGGARLDGDARERLGNVARLLAGLPPGTPPVCLRIVGHSDARGSEAANMRLSLARAGAVADYLGARLPAGARIEEVAGAGPHRPLPGLAPEAPENRRVALMARTCPGKVR